MEGIHDRPGLGQLLAGGTLETGEAIHRHHLNPPTPGLAPSGEPGLEDLLGPARDHVQKPGRTTAVAYGGQVDDDGDIAVAPPGVAPHMLINAEDLYAIEAVGCQALGFVEAGLSGAGGCRL